MSKRGFASMDKAKQRQIASAGGLASQATGKAHKFNSAEAKEAGKRGGAIVSANRQHMSRIGSVGGRRRGEMMRDRKEAAAILAEPIGGEE